MLVRYSFQENVGRVLMGQLYPEEVCNENWRKAVYFMDLSGCQCVSMYFLISACGSCQGRLLRVRSAEKRF